MTSTFTTKWVQYRARHSFWVLCASMATLCYQLTKLARSSSKCSNHLATYSSAFSSSCRNFPKEFPFLAKVHSWITGSIRTSFGTFSLRLTKRVYSGMLSIWVSCTKQDQILPWMPTEEQFYYLIMYIANIEKWNRKRDSIYNWHSLIINKEPLIK